MGYALGARCAELLSCAAPVAAYHSLRRQEALAIGLAQLPVFCIHSVSATVKTCPIEDELPLWKRIRDIGGDLKVKKVQCKHGKTFSHAYEHDTELWDCILQQRRHRQRS